MLTIPVELSRHSSGLLIGEEIHFLMVQLMTFELEANEFTSTKSKVVIDTSKQRTC